MIHNIIYNMTLFMIFRVLFDSLFPFTIVEDQLTSPSLSLLSFISFLSIVAFLLSIIITYIQQMRPVHLPYFKDSRALGLIHVLKICIPFWETHSIPRKVQVMLNHSLCIIIIIPWSYLYISVSPDNCMYIRIDWNMSICVHVYTRMCIPRRKVTCDNHPQCFLDS